MNPVICLRETLKELKDNNWSNQIIILPNQFLAFESLEMNENVIIYLITLEKNIYYKSIIYYSQFTI